MWRRRKDNLKRRMMSGILACLLVATSLTNTVGIITSFAGQTANIPRVSYKYDDLKNDKGQLDKMVQINVQAENESFAPGSEMVLKVYVQNLSDQNLTGGSLKWSGKGLEEAGFLDEEEEDLFNGPGWDGEDNDSDTSDLMEDLGNFSVTGLRKSVALKVDDTAAKDETEAPEQNVEIITDVETEEEEDDTSDPQTDEEGKRIRGIELAPGEVYETRFYGTVEDMDSIVTRKVTFEFLAGTDDNKVAQDKAEFTYNTGMALVLPIEFDDGPALMTNELNTMYIHTRFEDEKILDEYTWEITDEDEATPSDAERHEITVATMSNGTEDSSEGTTPANMKYSIVTYGAKLEGIEAWYDDERSGWGEMTTGVSFRVKDDTEPGVYFGQVTTSIRREGKSYKTTQGFHFFVLGDGQLVLKGNINGAEIQVKGDRSSFPEGDMLSLKVTEVPAEKMDLVQEAMVQKAEELGVSVDKMKAMDIKVIADGVEQELEGEVEVTFSNLTLEKVEETIGLEDEEDIEDGEVEELEEINTNAVFGLRKASAGTEEDQADAAGETEIAEIENESEGEEKEESALAVWHLDEEAGVMNEMDSKVNDEGNVVMATEHFSIFIIAIIIPGQMGGDITVTVEHWGTVKTIEIDEEKNKGTNPGLLTNSNEYYEGNRIGYRTHDTIYDPTKAKIADWFYIGEIYESDTIIIPNKMEYGVEELSKVCRAMESDRQNYVVEKILITTGSENIAKNKGQEIWDKGSYQEYSAATSEKQEKIILSGNSLIRFIYAEKEIAKGKEQYKPVTFYDYNVSDLGEDIGKNQGTNSDENFNEAQYKMGAGQFSSGNQSDWMYRLPDEREETPYGYLNRGNYHDPEKIKLAKIVQNLVKPELEEGKLAFADNISHPDFFLESGKTIKGTNKITNYELGFKQNGDTYKLSTVKRKVGETEDIVLTELDDIKYTAQNKSTDTALFSNSFWPLDNELGDAKRDGKSDPGRGDNTHNWHFGMKFEFDFRVGDYVGPMNFYFRGDDDFWMFVDNKRVIDLGGIHSAEGAAIDLREWLKAQNGGKINKEASHHVVIYFMERGGFGSCCYMQFTIPNCDPVNSPENPQTSIKVRKRWVDGENPYRPESIDVTLLQLYQGMEIDKSTQTLSNQNNWEYTWNALPIHAPNDESKKYTYKLIERNVPDGYVSTPVEITLDELETQEEIYVREIENKLSPVKVKVTKNWDDGGDLCHSRPQELKFQLYANDSPYIDREGKIKIATMKAPWEAVEFENLPKYDMDGIEINYSVRELNGSEPIDQDGILQVGEKEYTVSYTDLTPSSEYVAHIEVTNTHRHKMTVYKEWSDNSNELPWVGLYKVIVTEKEGGIEERDDTSDSQTLVLEPVSFKRMEYLDGRITATFDNLVPYNYYTVRELSDGTSENFDFEYTFLNDQGIEEVKYLKGVEEGGYYQETYKVSYQEPTEVERTDCNQTVTIMNQLRKARIRVAKWIDNWNANDIKLNDLRDDDFIITVSEENSKFETGVVLQHAGDDTGNVILGKISGYIEVDVDASGTWYTVSETVPKEYVEAGIKYISNYSSGSIATNGTAATDGKVLVKPGDNGLIVVHNSFDHIDYFHNEDRVTNLFNSDHRPKVLPSIDYISLDALPPEIETGDKLEEVDDKRLL